MNASSTLGAKQSGDYFVILSRRAFSELTIAGDPSDDCSAELLGHEVGHTVKAWVDSSSDVKKQNYIMGAMCSRAFKNMS